MDMPICPICNLTVLSSELERHANGHFEDEETAKDGELAHQLAVAPSTPTQIMNDQVTAESLNEGSLYEIPERRVSRIGGLSKLNGELHIDEKISCLINLQIKSPFYIVKDGLMVLLANCLDLEGGKSTSILCGSVNHFQCIESEDVGWGCGWRNIQMLSSYLLMQREEAREVLFGGSGFVPDIPSLQRWLEVAWEKGFDLPGSDHFNKRIYGLRKWIGTTECAALFRSFGIRARVVDFGPKELESLYLSVPGSSLGSKVNNRGKRKARKVYGPMDKFLSRGDNYMPKSNSNRFGKSNCNGVQHNQTLGYENNDNITDDSPSDSRGQEVLIDWVWNYFYDESSMKSCQRHAFVSDNGPLYFQHDGHSRTIVGIQAIHQPSGIQKYNLLILDPGHRTAALERALKENVGWQRLIKRGVHTLKKPQYQLCYVEKGLATSEEMEQLKTIDSVFLEF